jgi:SAM-dependent methyltransferase
MANVPDEGDLRAPATRDHWNRVWGDADPDRVSWFEPRPETSLRLIESSGVGLRAGIIDVGGGASLLTGRLRDVGFEDLTVLDVSAKGLDAARGRLGPAALQVDWIHADVRDFDPCRTWDLWHDRAVFHFLTRADDREAYLATLGRALPADGQVILATFGPEGPTRCSGLDVRRYSRDMLVEELGPMYRLEDSFVEPHTTPSGSEQQFLYARFVRVG